MTFSKGVENANNPNGHTGEAQEKPEGRILIVDDDYSLRRVLQSTFFMAGFDVTGTASGEEALAVARAVRYDIVLLSLRIPGRSGIEICRELRRRFPRLAILILTVSETEDEKIEALDAGADDYITKPFRMNELMARVRAASRRAKTLIGVSDEAIRIGDIELQPANRLVYKSNSAVHLTPKEFDLLHHLMAHAGVPIPHSQLLSAVWGADYVDRVEYLRTIVRQLRKKLGDDLRAPKYIMTRSYVGYQFARAENNHR